MTFYYKGNNKLQKKTTFTDVREEYFYYIRIDISLICIEMIFFYHSLGLKSLLFMIETLFL